LIQETHCEWNSKDKVINEDGRELIAFGERNNFEILNGNFSSDIRGEFTYISTIGSSVSDYALMTVGLLDRYRDFRVGMGY
jgi:hypothetical protein